MNLSLIPSNDNQPLTMSSREIAELTGKEHFHVKRDIRVMLEELGEDASNFGGMSKDAYGRPLEIFNLPKDLTITLVSGYSVQMRHRIVTRWMELEAQRQAAVQPLRCSYEATKQKGLELLPEALDAWGKCVGETRFGPIP